MQLQAWTEESPSDAARRRRLFVGYAVGSAVVTLALAVLAGTSHARVFEEEAIDVSLVKAPPIEALPEPEIEVAEEQKPKEVKPRRQGAKRAGGPPKEIPGGVPNEANPGGGEFAGDVDDLFGEGGSGEAGRTEAPKRKVAQAPVEKPRLPDVKLMLERANTSTPVAISRATPDYPEEAKKQGVNATVVVRYLVERDGSVSKVKIVSGHPLLNDTVIESVSSWRFHPGMYEGHAIAVWKTARFPFRLRS